MHLIELIKSNNFPLYSHKVAFSESGLKMENPKEICENMNAAIVTDDALG